MVTITNKLALTAVVLSGLMTVPAVTLANESSDPIKFVINNWSSQQVLTHISGQLLEQSGYSVEYYPLDTQTQFQSIGNGDAHVQIEIWEGTMAQSFKQQLASNRMIDAGSHNAVTREEWWYPDYMEDVCPGLPAWNALNECSKKLVTDKTKPRGRYLAGPADWERADRERVEALGLNFDIVNVTSPMSLWAELEDASKSKRPILLLNWTPNWTESKYPGEFVEFPAYHPDCEVVAAWGENAQLTHDCGNPSAGWLKRGVWSKFPEKWSCAFEYIKNISFTNEQIAVAAAYAEIEEMSPETAASRWISENTDDWNNWQPECLESVSFESDKVVTEQTVAANDTNDNSQFKALAKQNNCLSCHGIDSKLVGPSFNDVGAKYAGDAEAVDILFDKIKNGGGGAWGDIPMPPNPSVADEDIKNLISWILGMN